jgi:hypothetical protein
MVGDTIKLEAVQASKNIEKLWIELQNGELVST